MVDYTRKSITGMQSSTQNWHTSSQFWESYMQYRCFRTIAVRCTPKEDINAHITNFLEITNIFKINRVLDDSVRLCLFLFTPWDRAKSWLKSLPGGSITSWRTLVEKFLERYLPLSHTTKLKRRSYHFSKPQMGIYMKPGEGVRNFFENIHIMDSIVEYKFKPSMMELVQGLVTLVILKYPKRSFTWLNRYQSIVIHRIAPSLEQNQQVCTMWRWSLCEV